MKKPPNVFLIVLAGILFFGTGIVYKSNLITQGSGKWNMKDKMFAFTDSHKSDVDFIDYQWMSENYGSLESYLEKTATKVPIKASLQGKTTKAVTVVVIDVSYIEMFFNWHNSASISGIKNILPVAMTIETKNKLFSHGVDAYFSGPVSNISNVESWPKSEEFQRKELYRLTISRKILKMGYAVLLSDVDIVFFQNPYHYFECPDCDYEMENNMDHLSEKEVNPSFGLAYLKPSECTIDILGDLIQKLMKKPFLWKNNPFTKMIEGTVKTVCYGRLLHYEMFSTELLIQKDAKKTGKMQYERNKYGEKVILPANQQRLVTFHARVLPLIANKRYLLKEMGLWHLDTDEYYSNPHRKYITYYNPLNGAIPLEQETFKCAIILSYRLNRTLILPKFHCNGYIKQTGCTLLHFQKLQDFDPKYGKLYREHAFLANPKVPLSVLDSQSPVLFIPSPKLHSSKLTNIEIYPSKDVDKVPTIEELRKWTDLFSKYAILRFHSMYFSCMYLK